MTIGDVVGGVDKNFVGLFEGNEEGRPLGSFEEEEGEVMGDLDGLIGLPDKEEVGTDDDFFVTEEDG